jgi:hypothetical protein
VGVVDEGATGSVFSFCGGRGCVRIPPDRAAQRSHRAHLGRANGDGVRVRRWSTPLSERTQGSKEWVSPFTEKATARYSCTPP